MRHLIIHPEAEAEMLIAADFYESQQKVLRKRFLAAVQDGFTRLQINPMLYPLLATGVRRCLIRTFPFGVVFNVLDGAIIIISVMHPRRDPEHWKGRTSNH
jgi:toxin ParE1/3/4